MISKKIDMSDTDDMLECIFTLQRNFMFRLKDKFKDFPQEWPIDISNKKNQQIIRDLLWKANHEISEAVSELKNAKEHRTIDAPVSVENITEEVVDALKFMVEILILLGVNERSFYEAYKTKDLIINQRLDKE